MQKVELVQDIYWVGAVDWNLRNFHGYITPRGVTYNAYLIKDEKNTLVDTVKDAFAGELLKRISEHLDPAAIDYIVVNHVEPDHSSALPYVLEKANKAKIVTTDAGRAGLLRHYHIEGREWLIVKEGDTLTLGKRSLQFIPVPMLHWPDSMCSYMPEEGLLFSNDAFGQHISSTGRFDSEIDFAILLDEAAKYYANILMPFGSVAVKALDKVQGLAVNMIAPSHGVIWRTHLHEIVNAYWEWSRGKTQNKALVVYDTMWGSTEMMAKAIVEGLAGGGVETKLFRISCSDLSEIIKEALEAKAIIVGSPTLNNGMFPSVGGFLTYLTGLRPKGKIAGTFGSYGWGGGAIKAVEQALQQGGMEVLKNDLSIKYRPQPEERLRCEAFGLEVAQKMKQSL
jgi:anaerobic nitric oxide reductase flavorubredoxin